MGETHSYPASTTQSFPSYKTRVVTAEEQRELIERHKAETKILKETVAIQRTTIAKHDEEILAIKIAKNEVIIREGHGHIITRGKLRVCTAKLDACEEELDELKAPEPTCPSDDDDDDDDDKGKDPVKRRRGKGCDDE